MTKELTKNNTFNLVYKREYQDSEDYDFFLNIAKLDGKFHFINRPLGFRLIHDKSYSSKISYFEHLIEESKIRLHNPGNQTGP